MLTEDPVGATSQVIRQRKADDVNMESAATVQGKIIYPDIHINRSRHTYTIPLRNDLGYQNIIRIKQGLNRRG